MGKSLEMRRKKNLDSFDEIDEINWDGTSNTSGRTQEELDSIRDLLESDWMQELLKEELETVPRESAAIEKGVLESELDEEPQYLWDGLDIGKETINTPTQDKQGARQQEAILENERKIESITK